MHPEDSCAGEMAAATMGGAIGGSLRRHRVGDNRIDALDGFERRGDDGRQPSGGALVRDRTKPVSWPMALRLRRGAALTNRSVGGFLIGTETFGQQSREAWQIKQ